MKNITSNETTKTIFKYFRVSLYKNYTTCCRKLKQIDVQYTCYRQLGNKGKQSKLDCEYVRLIWYFKYFPRYFGLQHKKCWDNTKKIIMIWYWYWQQCFFLLIWLVKLLMKTPNFEGVKIRNENLYCISTKLAKVLAL